MLMLNEMFVFEKLISKTKRKKNWNDDTVLTSAKIYFNGLQWISISTIKRRVHQRKKNQNQNMLNISIRRKQLANDIVR